MITPSANTVNFFDSWNEIESSEPYAVLNGNELTSILKRFMHWAVIVGTHPEIAEIFGKSSAAHIKLATDLRNALKSSLIKGTFPNIVLPSRKFKSTMLLLRISKQLESEL